MKNVIMGIGVPGSGKSTILRKYAEENGWEVVSPDDLRKEFTGREDDHSREGDVWKETYARTKKAIEENRTVLVDATFSDDRYRTEFLDFLKQSGTEKIEGVYVDTSFETASERNRNRDRVVPEHAMERMRKQLEQYPPKLAEGFDVLYVLKEDGELHEIIPDESGNEIKRSMGKLR